MTMKQLLAGAALSALIAGAASAQEVTINNSGDFDGNAVLASEDGRAVSGNLQLTFDFDNTNEGGGAFDGSGDFAALGVGGEVSITVTMNNAEFTGPISAVPTFANPECALNITAGGGVGGNSITYTTTNSDLYLCRNENNDGGGDEDQAETESTIILPIALTTVGQSADVTISYTRNSGSAGYSAPVDAATDLVDYQAAFAHSFTAGDAQDLLLTGSTLLDWSATSAGVDQGFFGSLAAAPVTAGTSVDLAGTAATYANLLNGNQTVIISLADVTGVTGASFDTDGDFADLANQTACGAPDAGTNTIECVVPAADLAAGADIAFRLEVSSTVAVAQAPQDIGIELDYTLNTDYSEANVANAALALLDEDDGLGNADPLTNTANWARIGDGGSESNFRIALAGDASAASVTQVTATCGAASDAALSGAEITLLPGADVATNFRQSGNVVLFNSRALGAAAGATGNCDLTVNLQYDETDTDFPAAITGGRMDRLLIQRSGFGLSNL